jgi:inner membrane protein
LFTSHIISQLNFKHLNLYKLVLLFRGMDSLSQIVLGAAVGEVLLGKKLGNKGQLLGAIGGTLPDLDVLLNPLFSDEITKLQIHRGYSHAIVIHLLLSYPLAKWCHNKWKDLISFRRWYIFWASVLITHALLDCCTTYGTQLLLPFTDYLVGFNNITVVDPLWTIPFMLLLLVALFLKRESPKRIRWALAACSYAGLYMLLTFYHKYTVHRHFESELKTNRISYHTLKTTPTMFNNILWSGIAVAQDTIYFGEYSLLQDDSSVEWIAYPIHHDLIDNHPDQRAMQVLSWFGQGAYFAVPFEGGLDFFTAKWGRTDFNQSEPHKAFVFHWRIEASPNGWQAKQIMPDWKRDDFSKAFRSLWNRILDKPKAVSQMQ